MVKIELLPSHATNAYCQLVDGQACSCSHQFQVVWNVRRNLPFGYSSMHTYVLLLFSFISLTNLEIGDKENDILNHKMSFKLAGIAGDTDLHLQPVPIVDDYDEMDPDKPIPPAFEESDDEDADKLDISGP